jgi:hypothetical protein
MSEILHAKNVWSEFFDNIFTGFRSVICWFCRTRFIWCKRVKLSYIFLLFSLKYANHVEDQTASILKFIFFLCN